MNPARLDGGYLQDWRFDREIPVASPYASPLAEDDLHAPVSVRRRVFLPLALFLATCVTTYWVGGPIFAVAVMFILTTHELGHFFQAMRYQVPASLPYFIPMPVGPIGTMGAVIGMQAHLGDRKALFDIGITGPLAGLVPAIACSVVGLSLSSVIELAGPHNMTMLGEPLLFAS